MPKLEITSAKGLVQRSGSTSIALADDVMHGTKRKVEAITGAISLTVADSGKVFTVDCDSAYDITLPTGNANILGWNAIFINTDIASTNVDVGIVRGDTGNDVLVGNSVDAAADGAAGLTIAANKVNFLADGGDAVGDMVEIICFASSAAATKFVARAICAA
jgi:hypothetical protein